MAADGDVATALKEWGFGQYVPAFEERSVESIWGLLDINKSDLETVFKMTDSQDRKRFRSAVKALKIRHVPPLSSSSSSSKSVSASSLWLPESQFNFDVFLCHRGSDARYNENVKLELAVPLYSYLSTSFRVFLDKFGLDTSIPSNGMLHALLTCKTGVIFFSRGFIDGIFKGNAWWCLLELRLLFAKHQWLYYRYLKRNGTMAGKPPPRIFAVAVSPFQIDDCWDSEYATTPLPQVTHTDLQINKFELDFLKRDLTNKSPKIVKFMDDPDLTLRSLLSQIPFIALNGSDCASKVEMFQEVKQRLERLRDQKKFKAPLDVGTSPKSNARPSSSSSSSSDSQGTEPSVLPMSNPDVVDSTLPHLAACPGCTQEFNGELFAQILSGCGHAICGECFDALKEDCEGGWMVICPLCDSIELIPKEEEAEEPPAPRPSVVPQFRSSVDWLQMITNPASSSSILPPLRLDSSFDLFLSCRPIDVTCQERTQAELVEPLYKQLSSEYRVFLDMTYLDTVTPIDERLHALLTCKMGVIFFSRGYSDGLLGGAPWCLFELRCLYAKQRYIRKRDFAEKGFLGLASTPRVVCFAVPPFKAEENWSAPLAVVSHRDLGIAQSDMDHFRNEAAAISPQLLETLDDPNLSLSQIMGSISLREISADIAEAQAQLFFHVKSSIDRLKD